jgi:hypothetical protein
VREYFDAWANDYDPPKVVSTEVLFLDNHQVESFNVPAGPHGYVYFSGHTVVIAYVAEEAAPATAEDAFTKILANLR